MRKTNDVEERDLTDKEIYEKYDKRTKGIENTMQVQDLIILYSLAERGWQQLLKAILYAYKLGVRYGKRKAVR